MFCGRARNEGKGGGVGILVKNEKRIMVAPHYSNRDLEILWVSIDRKNQKPLYVGVYYGKQETTCNKEKIKEEMENLTEDLLGIKNEGEVIICMDANAKIGLLGEAMSRNGKLIEKVFDECEMYVMNRSEKCVGVVTRQNRKRSEEKSAIDFVVCSYEAEQWIKKMKIDEVGEFRMRNKAESDHNTILVEIDIPHVKKGKMEKITKWNLKASTEKYALYREKLAENTQLAESIMQDPTLDFTERYQKWEKLLYKIAISTIGKTTVKPNRPPPPSEEIKKLRQERRQLKRDFETERDKKKKREKMTLYIAKQKEIRDKLLLEEAERIDKVVEKLKSEKNNDNFWDCRRRLTKDESQAWMITKGKDGKRIYDPEMNKENMAQYYEELYTKRKGKDHPYHTEVQEANRLLSEETSTAEYDEVPTLIEVREVINNTKNRKATTDWNNELIKWGEDEMVRFIYPVIKAFWVDEKAAKQWNEGHITNVYKGKGDREVMDNQRGITVSSAIGTIAEELVYNRVIAQASFTQAQAGGQKGCSTADHVFILRNIMQLAKKEKREIIITYYDVKKAYDRACTDDMLYSMYKSNVKGKK